MFTILKENWDFRHQIAKLAKSNLIKTYKGSALGPLWAIIKPAVTIFVFWFALEVGLRGGRSFEINHVKGVPFIFWLIVGMIPWFFMSEAITEGSGCIRANKHFITRLPFPVSTVGTFTMLSKLSVNVILTAAMYVLALFTCFIPNYFHFEPSIYNLQYIFWYLPLMFIFFTSLSWITAPLSTISLDFHNLIRAAIQAIFWMSGIIYNALDITNPVLRYIILASPVNYFSNGFRYTFLYRRWFWEPGFETVAFLCILVFTLVVGSLVFNKLKKTLPDVM